ncbi:hypothetical protein GCM10026983_13660 [Gracilibacillus alcaliphilus]
MLVCAEPRFGNRLRFPQAWLSLLVSKERFLWGLRTALFLQESPPISYAR